jgi:hypothetical protein
VLFPEPTRRGVLSALVVLAWFGSSGVGRAQTAEATDPQFVFGQVGFSPAIVLSFGYDSNLNREPGAFTRGSEFFVIPQMRAFWRTRRIEVIGAAAAEYIRANDVEANQALTGSPKTNKLAEGMVVYTGSRLRLLSTVSEKQTNARPTGFEIGARSVRVERLAEGEARLKIGGRSDLTGRIARLRTVWDADQIYNGSILAENLDGQFDTGSVRVNIGLTPVTTVFAGVEFIDQKFFRAPIRDNTSRNIQGGVGFASPGLLSGQIVIGNRQATATAVEGSDVSGPTLQGNITYARPSGAALIVTVGSDKQASYDITQGFFRMTGGTVMATSRPLRGWSAFASVGYHRFVYSEPTNRFETTLTYLGGVSVRPRPRMRIGAMFEHYDRNAIGGGGLTFSGLLFRVYSTYGVTLVKPLDRPLP